MTCFYMHGSLSCIPGCAHQCTRLSSRVLMFLIYSIQYTFEITIGRFRPNYLLSSALLLDLDIAILILIQMFSAGLEF